MRKAVVLLGSMVSSGYWPVTYSVVNGPATLSYILEETTLNHRNILKLTIPAAVCTVFLFVLSGCDPIGCFPFLWPYTDFRISVRNKTDIDLTLNLAIGEIPSPQARYEEFSPIPDEVFQISNPPRFPAETSLKGLVRAKSELSVDSSLPLAGLGRRQSDPTELHERLMNKLITFIFTVSYNDSVVYQIVGWDLPDEDVTLYQIDEKLYGYYDTADENWVTPNGDIKDYPLLYSKLWNNKQAYWPDSPVYYIKVNSLDSIVLQEFDPAPDKTIGDYTYWKNH